MLKAARPGDRPRRRGRLRARPAEQPRRARPHRRRDRAGRLHGRAATSALALDVAATEFYADGAYAFEGAAKSAERDDRLLRRARVAPTRSSPSRTRWTRTTGTAGRPLTDQLGDRVQIVGDDLFVTNPERLAARHRRATPPTRCWSRSTRSAPSPRPSTPSSMAHRSGYRCMMSHRSGETEDTTIADLAVATDCGQIKTGAPGPVASGSRSTTSCCASRRSSTTPRATPGRAAFPRHTHEALDEDHRMTYDERRAPTGGPGGRPRLANLTGRAAVLALVVCLLAISLAYPLREYLAQRGDISGYRGTRSPQQEKRVAELRAAAAALAGPGLRRGAGARAAALRACRARRPTSCSEPDEAPARGRRGRRGDDAGRHAQPVVHRPVAHGRGRGGKATVIGPPADRRRRRRGAARPARRAACARSRTAARAASPTWSRPRRGCPTARRSPRSTTSPARARPARSARSRPSGLMREMTDRLASDDDLRGSLCRRRTRPTSRGARRDRARCPRSTASPPAACPTG